MLTELLPKNIDKCNVDIWSQDESRVGQQGSLVYGLNAALDPAKFGNSNSFQHTSMELLAMIPESLLH